MTDNRKLLATDFDGTLFRQKAVSTEDIAAIEKWQAAGNLFVVCTGRGYCSISRELKKWGIRADYFILNNGAAAASYEGEFLFKTLMEEGSSLRLFELAQTIGCKHLVVNREDGYHLYYREDQTEPDEHFRPLEEVLAVKGYTQVNVAFRSEPEKAALCADMITRKFPDISVNPNHSNVDCVAGGNDKGTGIARLAAHFSLPESRCFAIGNGMNDYPMIARFNGAAVEETAEPMLLGKKPLLMESVGAYIEYLMKNG